MYFIELHNGIQKIIDLCIRLGFWHRGDVANSKETSLKLFYSFCYVLFPLSLLLGGIASDRKDESMLLVQSAIITTVALMRLLYLMWRQKEIYELLHRIGVYSIKDEEDFNVVDNKLKSFMKWIMYFYYYTMVVAACAAVVLPLIGRSDKKLFLNIAFPLDYGNNEIAYWIAALFLLIEIFLGVISVSCSIIIWFLMLNCGIKYQVLGSELRNMGVVRTVAVKQGNFVENRNFFKRDLISGIESHKYTKESTQRLESFLSNIQSLQLATSAFCICASVHRLAFNNSGNIMELHTYMFYLFYNIMDIFMVMYFGNEIKLSSDGLSYCLFKSNWMEQSQSCKKTIIIFGERLKQTHQLVVWKLYPLTLKTFTSILNAAYSLFNILKTLA